MKNRHESWDEIVGSYCPSIVREFHIEIDGMDKVVKVDLQPNSLPGNAEAVIQIGLQSLTVRGEYLLTCTPEEFLSRNKSVIQSALESYMIYESKPTRNKSWVAENLPVMCDGVTITGEICNGSEIRIYVKDENDRYLHSVSSIYEIEDAEAALSAMRQRIMVTVLTDYEAMHTPGKLKLSPNTSVEFIKGKPKSLKFAARF